MPRISTSDALFPKTRQLIIGRLFADPDKWTYQSELASDLSITQSSLQVELKRLISSGILESQNRGNRIYFRPNKDCIIFDELVGIATKTSGLVDLIREFLRSYEKDLAVAFIFGSIARNEERQESDVDLMLIGNLSLAKISQGLRQLEKKLEREVNPHVMTVEEASKMLRSPNHFFASVVKSPKIMLVRKNHELARLFEQGPSEKTYSKRLSKEKSTMLAFKD